MRGNKGKVTSGHDNLRMGWSKEGLPSQFQHTIFTTAYKLQTVKKFPDNFYVTSLLEMKQ